MLRAPQFELNTTAIVQLKTEQPRTSVAWPEINSQSPNFCNPDPVVQSRVGRLGLTGPRMGSGILLDHKNASAGI